MSNNVRKFRFPIMFDTCDVVYNLSSSLLPPIVLDNLFQENHKSFLTFLQCSCFIKVLWISYTIRIFQTKSKFQLRAQIRALSLFMFLLDTFLVYLLWTVLVYTQSAVHIILEYPKVLTSIYSHKTQKT